MESLPVEVRAVVARARKTTAHSPVVVHKILVSFARVRSEAALVLIVVDHEGIHPGRDVLTGKDVIHIPQKTQGCIALLPHSLNCLSSMELQEIFADQVSLDQPAQEICDRSAGAVVDLIRLFVFHGCDPVLIGFVLLAVLQIIYGSLQAKIFHGGFVPGPFGFVCGKDRELHARSRVGTLRRSAPHPRQRETQRAQ